MAVAVAEVVPRAARWLSAGLAGLSGGVSVLGVGLVLWAVAVAPSSRVWLLVGAELWAVAVLLATAGHLVATPSPGRAEGWVTAAVTASLCQVASVGALWWGVAVAALAWRGHTGWALAGLAVLVALRLVVDLVEAAGGAAVASGAPWWGVVTAFWALLGLRGLLAAGGRWLLGLAGGMAMVVAVLVVASGTVVVGVLALGLTGWAVGWARAVLRRRLVARAVTALTPAGESLGVALPA
jgi:hypothetical protein